MCMLARLVIPHLSYVDARRSPSPPAPFRPHSIPTPESRYVRSSAFKSGSHTYIARSYLSLAVTDHLCDPSLPIVMMSQQVPRKFAFTRLTRIIVQSLLP